MYLYGVFIGSKWAMSRNKRRALKYARHGHGYVVQVKDCPEISSYDAPTFRALGERIADYRPAQKPEQPVYTDCRNCGTTDHRYLPCPCECHERPL